MREDHSFVGLYRGRGRPIEYLAPASSPDTSPRWSPGGDEIAFVRRPGLGGPPEPQLEPHPEPWAVWVADLGTGTAHAAWSSPETLEGSLPETAGGADLHWGADGRLAFLSDLDGWPHLYSVPASGGEPLLLTPGDSMVEHVTVTPDHEWIVYHHTVDLVQRLRKAGVSYEELVLPNEIHGFLRWQSWLRADEATAAFLTEKLQRHGSR
jgi:dipeptidyl aminopeptidase/acylaminoacyl peptidase